MKYLSHLLALVLLIVSCPLSLLAHDFSAKNADGVTIYYNKISATKCQVTFYNKDKSSAKYSGSITIPSSVTYLGTTYSVTSIGYAAFQNCKSLSSISLPSSLTSIGDDAFHGCTSLNTISLPTSLTSINVAAFSGCTSLTSISIPDSVSSIRAYAFQGCNSLTSISLESTAITDIERFTFEECYALTSISLPSSLSSIDKTSFYGCYSLSYITVFADTPPTFVNPNNYWEDSYLSEATLYVPIGSKSLYASSIGYRFRQIIEFDPTSHSDHYFSTHNADGISIYYNKLSDTECAVTYTPTKYSGSISIPATVTYAGTTYSVTSIGNYAFYYCSSLNTISLPASITSIGKSAFYGCSSLNNISLPGSITSIGDYAFTFCDSLASISIPKFLTSIGNGAFEFCTSLNSISLESTSLTSIGEIAFLGCTSLNSISIPNTVTSIGNGAFQSCTFLSSITVDPANPNYSSLDGVLFNKDQSILICYPGGKQGTYNVPYSVTSISSYAFYGCTTITSISLPSSLISIGEAAFYGCESLTSVTSLSTTPPSGGNALFYDIPLSSATLYVPISTKSLYASTYGWRDFGTIIEIDTSSLNAISQYEPQSSVIYTINGRTTTAPAKDIITIQRMNDGTTRKQIVR